MSKFKNDWDWRDLSDPIPNEIMDKFEIKDSPFKKPKKDELGPENKEACELMEAQGSLLEYDKKTETETEDGEYNNTEGVGKDVYGKYAFAEMEHKGKKYFVQVRARETYDGYVEITEGRMIGPKLEKERLQ
tara:strand:- start:524 stop:919 length:396 start_codon:yes stop_codon:yes gene_type:complete